jgi:hypothetical protein
MLRVLRLLESDVEGEREAAAHAAYRLLKAEGVNLIQALGIDAAPHEGRGRHPKPQETDAWHIHRWTRTCRVLLTMHRAELSEWEVSFCSSLLKRNRPLTPKQTDILLRIHGRFVGDPP